MARGSFKVGGSVVKVASGPLYIANVPPPFSAADPVISGSTVYAGNVTVTAAATFKGPYTISGQVWQNNGEDTDQTGSTYVKSTADAGDQIRLKTYASGPGGSVFAYSSAITLVGLLSFSSGALPQGQSGSAYSFTVTATGGTAPYTFTISALPAGLSLNASTGLITGTPAETGDTTYLATVTDANGLTATMSGTASITTTPVGAISDLAYAEVTSSSVQLTFSSATNASSYQYRLNAGTWTTLAGDKIITGLSSSTTYTIDVRGINAFGNGTDSNDISVTTSVSSRTPVGLGYTPAYVPSFTLRATRALLLTDLGLTTSDVITASDYANVEAALDAANAAQKPLVVGTDNGAYATTTTRTRVYCDVPVYGYGSSMPRITGATRLSGWFCVKANDIKIYGVDFKDFTQVLMYTPGTMPLARPDATGYNAATSAAIRSPYHTSTDPMVVACLAAVDAGFITQTVGHISVSGSPTITSIKPVRLQQDGGPGGTRIPYNYKPSGQTYMLYDDANPSGDSNWAAVLDTSTPNLLASTLIGATNTSLAAAINANSGTTGYSAQVDPSTQKVAVLSTSYLNRVFDWTVASTGGTVNYDAIGPALNLSYCKFSGCDRVGGGIGDTTAVGRIDFHKNVLRATWGGLAFAVLNWTEFWAANNDYQDCLLSGGTYGTVAGRTAGNAQNRTTNQDGTLVWLGANNECVMRYIKARGGTKFHFDNNLCQDIEGNTNKDTVNSAGIVDVRNVWDTSANRRDNHTFSYNVVTNVRNVLGAIDSNVFYLKGSSFTLEGNLINGFGAKRVSSYRGNISSGSECAGLLFKNNGYDYDSSGTVYMAYNYLTNGPNGLPWIKWDDFGGGLTMNNNRLTGWTSQLDDATLGDATGRADTAWVGNATASGTALTINSTTSGTLAVGMRIVIGSSAQTLKSGSGASWVLVGSMTASGAATADYVNIIDGALIRGYQSTANVKFTSNYFENIADQGRVVALMHSITNLGGTFAGWEASNNVAKNDNSAAYPQHTGQEDWFYLDNTPSGMGAISTLVLGRNKTLNAAGAEVGAISFRYGATYYTNNGNSTLKDYVVVP